MRESDWAALADIQFILYNRIANQLNEALSGIALSDMPEASGKSSGYWKERAVDKITNVLNMFTAWTWLIRYKSGETIPQRAIRPFETNALLAWLGRQLQLNPPPTTNMNPLLHGNQETLQEALLLLYSVAYTQGSSVRLAFEATKLGTWFRIRFNRHHDLPGDIDALLATFSDHWRDRDTAFELSTARDFVRLNGCALTLNVTDTGADFAFFVRSAKLRPPVMAPVKPAPAARQPGQTKPLDPEALVRYLDQRAPAKAAPDTDICPPTLAMLRPFSAVKRAPTPEKTSTDTIILRAQIPEPKLPDRFHKPPAATSNVALTRDTQTFTAIKPEAAESHDDTDRQEWHETRPAKEEKH